MLPSLLPYPYSPVYDAVSAVSSAALLPLWLAWTQSHSSYTEMSRWWLLSWGQHQPITWLILWLWRLFHPIMWRPTKSSRKSLACLICILILLCGTFWYSLMLPCGLVQESCWECACGPEGEGVLRPICSSVWFVTGYVSFPLTTLLWFLETAEGSVISSRELCVQDLAVHQDHHQLHRRGEPPSPQRAGPLTRNCTRGGA